ncbi:DUF4760 domain-containing protein [Pseudomonas chlororaphis]|uniref:hypothetical protein n=1 Tax=Pseudomonas TaxID=286 RepID=UPI000D727412|nr:hypothetical protein [Pseudomonas sp. RW409]PWY53350.1 hypothetical protein DK261_02380 [Pseudomonas sp. RW409]
MWVWREAREKWLLAGAVGVLVLIVLINLKLSIWPWLDGGQAAVFLRADATGSVTSDLLVGLFSAYVFYVIVELMPRHRREKLTLRPLNMIVAAVIDAYERAMVFGHETPITSVELAVLDIEKLKAHKSELMTKRDLLKVKFAMETGHSRYPDFQHALAMAASISPEHALSWLVLTDKVRLLAEQYELWPVNPFTNNYLGQPTDEQCGDAKLMEVYGKYQEDMASIEGTLRLRVIEVIEATIFWLEQQAS